MSRWERHPDSCGFRGTDDSCGGDRAICGLVGHVLGDLAEAPCYVGRAECEACCRNALPSGPRLNPVVAALVLSAARRSGNRVGLGPSQQVALHQVRQFATRWLNRGADRGRCGPAESDLPCLVGTCEAPSADPGSIARHASGAARSLRIGLVGPNSSFGLGHQNRDIVIHLGIDRWLVPSFLASGELSAPRTGCRIDMISRELSPLELEAWLDGLDVVLFVESPVFPALPRTARQAGVRVVCVPNWEWLHPGLEWLEHVNLMLCPTRHTADLLGTWKAHFGFGWDIDCVPWPVDTNRFRYRRRSVCRRFVFVNGSGGVRALRGDGSPSEFRRKGLDVVLAAARQVPQIPVIVYAVARDVAAPPPNVDLRPLPGENTLLYCDGDVCVQPSHWEGLGLPLLECQSAGMPLITTDAPPMNEHRALAHIPVRQLQAVYLSSELCVPAAEIQPDDLARVLRSVHGGRIAAASRRARHFVEREHSWAVAGPQILQRLALPDSRDDSGRYLAALRKVLSWAR